VRGQIAESDPDVGAWLTDENCSNVASAARRTLPLVEALALEERAAEHELGLADLVEEVPHGLRAAAAPGAHAPRLLPLAEPEMNGGEATHGLGCVALGIDSTATCEDAFSCSIAGVASRGGG